MLLLLKLPCPGSGLTGCASLFILIVSAYWLFHLSVAPGWQSWIGDLVPENERGKFFSRRSVWIQSVAFLSVVAGGVLLHRYGFALILFIAFLGRFLSFLALGKQEEPAYHSPPESQFSFGEFVRKMRFNNYGIFVIYSSLTLMAVNIAGPFFSVYILKQLQFSYLEFMLTQAVFIGAKSLFLPLWGHYSDRYGSRKLLSLAGYLLPTFPLCWLFTTNLTWILAIQFFAGFVWGGFELCSFNFILDCTTPQKRARCSAYYQLFGRVGMVLGALLGGFLLEHPLLFSEPFLFIFFISGLVRLYLTGLLSRIRDLRVVEPIAYRTLLWRLLSLQKSGSE